MTGFLVVNAYLKSEKFDALHAHLVSAAEKLGITLEIIDGEAARFCEKRPDFVLFWDKDTALARELERAGVPVFNSARAIELCDDKAKTYAELLGVVPQPKTLTAPLGYYADTDYTAFVNKAAERLGLPLVYKERCGSFGEQVYLCKSVEEILSRINGKPFLLQEFVACSAGEDVRIEVIGGKAAAAMKRKNGGDFRSNITNGASAEPYSPTEAEKQTAVKACSTLGLDFGGVDILNNGQVCEVNSNAHIINLMNVTGVDIAPLIFKYILEKI